MCQSGAFQRRCLRRTLSGFMAINDFTFRASLKRLPRPISELGSKIAKYLSGLLEWCINNILLPKFDLLASHKSSSVNYILTPMNEFSLHAFLQTAQ